MMSTSVAVEANNLRPSRVNAAGWCVYCVTQNCTAARCIDIHARTEWEVCGKCGGSEYIDGHIDPETACRRCDCFGGLIEAADADAEVIELAQAANEVAARMGAARRARPSSSVTVTVTGDTAARIGLVNVPGYGI
ncbi:hypothetical protein [Nocardia brasiliensis]|uniref:hypothetical protein n=1 Tax=Nocardia brasiliensis TaxID=37326 RepID=UPI0033C9B7CF